MDNFWYIQIGNIAVSHIPYILFFIWFFIWLIKKNIVKVKVHKNSIIVIWGFLLIFSTSIIREFDNEIFYRIFVTFTFFLITLSIIQNFSIYDNSIIPKIVIQTFWVYTITLVPTYIFAYLQLKGKIPYSYIDWVDGKPYLRLSGMYSKSINLAMYINSWFFMYITLITSRILKKSRQILFIPFAIIGMYYLYLAYHRTSLIVLFIIFILVIFKYRFLRSNFRTLFRRFSLLYVLWQLTFPILIFLIIRFINLRGRSNIWYSHLLQIRDNLQNSFIDFIFGQGNSFSQYTTIFEVHNDNIFILEVLGFVGLLFYTYLTLSIVLAYEKKTKNFPISFIGFFLYSLTYQVSYFNYFVFNFIFLILFEFQMDILYEKSKNMNKDSRKDKVNVLKFSKRQIEHT